MVTCFRVIEMAAARYPGGWEVDSDAETNHSEEMGDRLASMDALYDAGHYGGGRCLCLGSVNGAGLDPEEEQNLRREARRAVKARPVVPLRLTKSMEDLLKTFPLLLADDNKIEEEDDD